MGTRPLSSKVQCCLEVLDVANCALPANGVDPFSPFPWPGWTRLNSWHLGASEHLEGRILTLMDGGAATTTGSKHQQRSAAPVTASWS